MNSKLWDDIWQRTHINSKMIERVESLERSTIFKLIQGFIQDKFRSFRNVRVIELGSGLGKMSLLMSIMGAKVTLLDFSAIALQKSAMMFKQYGVHAEYVCSDIFNLPEEICGRFDVSMSFGLAEHCREMKRQRVFDIHFKVLMKNGVAFIQVPNYLCVPYRFKKLMDHKRKKWQFGFEAPFSKRELLTRARFAGFRESVTFCTDLQTYLREGYFSGRLLRVGRFLDRISLPRTIDDRLGYTLLLCATK